MAKKFVRNGRKRSFNRELLAYSGELRVLVGFNRLVGTFYIRIWHWIFSGAWDNNSGNGGLFPNAKHYATLHHTRSSLTSTG